MAGLAPEPAILPAHGALSSRQFFRTIVWLRWRIFANGLRGKGALGELAVTILSYFVLAVVVIGPSVGAGASAWYLVSRGMDAWLAIPLWIIFVLWQVVGASTSASGPAFSLDSLVRFPIRYRDYLLMRLTFGLMDPPTLAGFGCLLAMTIGVGAAEPSLLPWAALALLTYALANLFFSRMIYTWLERWLAQRRTREMVTVLILAGSLGIQVVSQFINRFTMPSHHVPPSPWMLAASHILLAANRVLPPGLAASSIAQMHSASTPLATLCYLALLAYTAFFLYILHLRLHAQYLGENLSEAPAARAATQPRRKPIAAPASAASSRPTLIPPQLAALFLKEFRLLLRSGPRLYALVMPVFIVYIFSFRTTGLAQAGITGPRFTNYLFTYSCAYTLLVFTNLFYNSLGNEGAGVQFYFLAPIRIRDVLLAKNLLLGGIFAVEIALIYIATLTLHIHTAPALAMATLAWTAFTFLLHLIVGNVRSLVAPKGYDPARMRSQNVSAVSSFISLGITFAASGLGQFMLVVCQGFHFSLWSLAALFLVLACITFAFYLLVLSRSDSIAASHREELTRELGKF
jgi:ABC-2 type transport system permease protein